MRRYSHAFTLIELLVVISIIALLIGILLPTLGAARKSARDMQCLSNQRQIGVGLYGYAQEYKETLPLSYYDGGGIPANATDWGVSIAAFMSEDGATDYAKGGRDQPSPGLRCPSANVEGGRLHYGANMMVLPFLISGAYSGGLTPYRLYQMKRPTEILMVADGTQTTSPEPQQDVGDTYANLDGLANFEANDTADYYNAAAADNNEPIDPGPNADGALVGADARDLRWRHGGGDLSDGSDDGNVNGLFGDGHATSNQRGDLLKRNVKVDK